jgi:hypothetical protein
MNAMTGRHDSHEARFLLVGGGMLVCVISFSFFDGALYVGWWLVLVYNFVEEILSPLGSSRRLGALRNSGRDDGFDALDVGSIASG